MGILQAHISEHICIDGKRRDNSKKMHRLWKNKQNNLVDRYHQNLCNSFKCKMKQEIAERIVQMTETFSWQKSKNTLKDKDSDPLIDLKQQELNASRTRNTAK